MFQWATSLVFLEKTSNDKLASAHLFTLVSRPPRLKILILFMTFNIFNQPYKMVRHSTNWSANLSLCVRFNSQSIYIITKAGPKWDHHIWLSYCIRNDLDPPLTLLILWHFRDLLGTFMIYAQFMKGVSSNFGG